MRFAVLALVVLFLTASTVSAQMNDEEIYNLRKQINIPAKDIIRQDKNAKLNDNNSLKVFLAIKRNGSEAKYFQKWVQDWNREEASKYGKLEIVEEIAQADAVLTQFVSTQTKLVKDTAIGIGNIPPPGRLKSKVKVTSEIDYKHLKLPVYSYLIKREDNIWTIIYENVETSLPDEQLSVSPESRLWRVFKKEMKSR